jgi:hypothetical protein
MPLGPARQRSLKPLWNRGVLLDGTPCQREKQTKCARFCTAGPTSQRQSEGIRREGKRLTSGAYMSAPRTVSGLRRSKGNWAELVGLGPIEHNTLFLLYFHFPFSFILFLNLSLNFKFVMNLYSNFLSI